MTGTEGVCTGKNQALELRSLRGSTSEGSLSGQEADAEPSPQSFAALKQAYDFMLPQYKALQTDKRYLQKENEELKKRLTVKEDHSVEMSNNFEEGYPSDLKSKGQSTKRTSTAITGDEESDKVSQDNGDFRVSPCSAMDSAINLNDCNSLVIEKSIREEREKWLYPVWTLLLYFPEEKLPSLPNMSEHCFESLNEYASSKSQQDREIVAAKINKIKTTKSNPGDNINFMPSQLVTPINLGYSPGVLAYHEEVPKVSATTGKYDSVGTSEEDPSDEDIYTSGLPRKLRGKKMIDDDEDGDDEGEEWVRVDNAMDVLARCADFLHQSLEVNMDLMNKLSEKKQPADKGSASPRRVDTVSQLPIYGASHPPPHKPIRSHLPVFDGRKRQAMSSRHFENVRPQPSVLSDPGRVVTGMSHLNLNSESNSDPLASRRWNSVARSRGRPLSEADLSGPLHELSVKYPPMPYQDGSSFKTPSSFNEMQLRPPPQGSENPMTIDHNFQFDDGLTYQPCGPPETDMKHYGSQEEDHDIRDWNAARNPDLYEDYQPSSPRNYSRSDPVKNYSAVHEKYLPRSSDRIYDMGSQPYVGSVGTSNVTRASHSKIDREHFRLSNEPIKESPVCPVCNKVFDPATPDVAVQSHVNLHFENDVKNFEVIEQ